jgi:hypothetical protein
VLTKRLEQPGLFTRPRSYEFGPFQACRVPLGEPCQIKNGTCRNSCRSFAGLLFFLAFVLRKKGRRPPMEEAVGNVMPTNGLLRDGLLPRLSAPVASAHQACLANISLWSQSSLSLLLRSQSLRYESPVRFLFLRKNGRSLSSGAQSQGLFLPFPQYAMGKHSSQETSDGGPGTRFRPPTSPHPLPVGALLLIGAGL